MLWVMHGFQEAMLVKGTITFPFLWISCVFFIHMLTRQSGQLKKKKEKRKIKNKEIKYTCYFDPKQVHDSLVHTDISTGMLAL